MMTKKETDLVVSILNLIAELTGNVDEDGFSYDDDLNISSNSEDTLEDSLQYTFDNLNIYAIYNTIIDELVPKIISYIQNNPLSLTPITDVYNLYNVLEDYNIEDFVIAAEYINRLQLKHFPKLNLVEYDGVWTENGNIIEF